MSDALPAVRLFVGGHAGTIQGEREDLAGDRMFTAAHPPQAARNRAACGVNGIIDSGAFTDVKQANRRLSLGAALDRQLAWEQWASDIWQSEPWQASGIVSYDRLIDETWVAGERHKRRWSVQQAESAVVETIDAAHYLASQRQQLAPRRLILSCQGVDAAQYEECAIDVLKAATPADWIGLGGWCILGIQRSLLPTFWATLYRVLPRIADAGMRHVHIFGVTWFPPLGGLIYLADQYGLTVSTDSTGPVLSCTWKNKKKSGARCDYWRDNVAWWIDALGNLRTTAYYKAPPRLEVLRQETFL